MNKILVAVLYTYPVVTVNCAGKMGFRPNNLMTKAFIMKFVELVSFSCEVSMKNLSYSPAD